jgi:hypothetical protein
MPTGITHMRSTLVAARETAVAWDEGESSYAKEVVVKLIAIEEHFRAPVLRSTAESGFERAMGADDPMAERMLRLDEVGPHRLADMDAERLLGL